MGGDGLFNRVANSLLMQTQLEAGVDLSRPRFIPARPRAKLGIIPAGYVAVCLSVLLLHVGSVIFVCRNY